MTSKTGSRRGFTLVEVLVATAVLSLGIAFIYEAFFISLNGFNYYRDYLNISPWADEEIWEAEDSLTRYGDLDRLAKEGEFLTADKKFAYALSGSLIDQTSDQSSRLYKVDLAVIWREGKIYRRISKTAYAVYKKPEE